MTAPIRIQRRRAKGWRLPDNSICVDRSTPWGNPFIVGVDGTVDDCVNHHILLLSGRILLTVKASIDSQLAHLDHVKAHIEELRGKNLACWCRADRRCHADTLLLIANAGAMPPSIDYTTSKNPIICIPAASARKANDV